MNKTPLPILALLLVCIFSAHAQKPPADQRPDAPADIFTLGFGFGLDYGGLGVNATVYPQKNIGIFGGVGYALAGAGYNVGVKLRLLPNHGYSRVRPFLEGMYGYNAAVVVSNAPQYNKLYYGPSVGAGVDIGLRNGKTSFSLAILVPIRSPDVNNYINELQNNYGVTFGNLSPVDFSFGFKISLGS
jgi:hypothetical protein